MPGRLVFTEKQRVELEPCPLVPPATGQVLVRTAYTLMSTGTESIVSKPLPNAFAQTDLDAALKKLGRTQLVIAGFMTHMCVSSTARAALDLGYKATVAADAAATRDLPDPMGGVIAADALHRAALAELADRFAIVATVDRIPEK